MAEIIKAALLQIVYVDRVTVPIWSGALTVSIWLSERIVLFRHHHL